MDDDEGKRRKMTDWVDGRNDRPAISFLPSFNFHLRYIYSFTAPPGNLLPIPSKRHQYSWLGYCSKQSICKHLSDRLLWGAGGSLTELCSRFNVCPMQRVWPGKKREDCGKCGFWGVWWRWWEQISELECLWWVWIQWCNGAWGGCEKWTMMMVVVWVLMPNCALSVASDVCGSLGVESNKRQLPWNLSPIPSEVSTRVSDGDRWGEMGSFMGVKWWKHWSGKVVHVERIGIGVRGRKGLNCQKKEAQNR